MNECRQKTPPQDADEPFKFSKLNLSVLFHAYFPSLVMELQSSMDNHFIMASFLENKSVADFECVITKLSW
uniref:Uncharacterized protein n=1 Tax=Zonotrichia albicollis TaxID=44394 RepID=A0A8D2MNH0_ZONAL